MINLEAVSKVHVIYMALTEKDAMYNLTKTAVIYHREGEKKIKLVYSANACLNRSVSKSFLKIPPDDAAFLRTCGRAFQSLGACSLKGSILSPLVI